MKNLSIEEKAKRYDDALERAKKLQHDNAWVTSIFPELKESEDERIRNSIIRLIEKSHEYGGYALHKDEAEKMLAWLEKQDSNVDNANKEYWRGYREGKQEIIDKYAELEKQGEQKPVDVRTTGYWHVEDVEQNPVEEYNITGISSNKSQGKLGEIIKNLKATWSEEDEEILRAIISDGIRGAEFDMLQIDWLKSIKNRYAWKPSDKQLEAFEHFVRSWGESGISSPYNNYTKLIYSLLQDLKRLREE